MGRIGDDDIRRVREATDVISLISERVVLKQKGRLFWGCCPFHNEKTPSFKVDPASQLWHCFGCGKGGDAFGFLMESDSLEFPEAVRALAERSNIEIVEEGVSVPRGRKERIYAVCEAAAEFYHVQLNRSSDGAARNARSYLSSRGFGSEIAKRWTIGFAPGRGALVAHLRTLGFTPEEMIEANVALSSDRGALRDRFYERIMFPIADLQGRVIAFGGRVVGKGEPKYLNSQETLLFHKSSNLFAIDRAKSTIVSTGDALVTEGYTDVISLHEAGFTGAVATLGTALTEQHVKLLSRFAKRIVYVFDGDEAGMRAADRASEFIDSSIAPESGRRRTELFVAVLPSGKDPADLVSQDGADAFRSVVDQAVPLLRFSIDRRLARWDLERPEERARALRDAAEILAPVKGSILADDYANYIADRLLADYSTVRQAINATPDRKPANSDTVQADSVQPQPIEAVETPESRMERELLSLITTVPQLRYNTRELLGSVEWTLPLHRSLAEAISSVGASTPPAELLASLDHQWPGTASMLSAGYMETAEPAQVAGLLRDRLVEAALERKIKEGNARLRSESGLSPKEFDGLFEEVVCLQKQLADIRKSKR